MLEYGRKVFPCGHYNGHELRPQWKGTNSLFWSLNRKVTYHWKSPLSPKRSSYGQNYGLAAVLKEHIFSHNSCLTALRAPLGCKNPHSRILRLRWKCNFSICGESRKSPFGRTLENVICSPFPQNYFVLNKDWGKFGYWMNLEQSLNFSQEFLPSRSQYKQCLNK